MASASPCASAKISSRPRPVRRESVSARIARACSSVSRTREPSISAVRGSAISSISGSMSPTGQSRPTSRSRASAGSFDERMMTITSSMLTTAMARPTSTWPRSRALPSSNLVRRTTTSSRKSTKIVIMSRRFISTGRPRSSASALTPNEDCRAVKR